jgi:hypothetical protein
MPLNWETLGRGRGGSDVREGNWERRNEERERERERERE